MSPQMQQTVAYLRSVRDEAPPPPADPAEALRLMRERAELIAQLYPTPDDVRVEDVDAGGVPADLLLPPGVDDRKVLLYLHGGAYVAYSPRSHRELAARIGRAAGCAVLVPDYRLAPEHPWPAAVEDALTALTWLRAQGRQVSLAGDSAGGGLALAVSMRLREAGQPQADAIALLSPWTDLAMTGASVGEVEDDPTLDAARLRGAGLMYAGGADPAGPELSPLHADLTGLPPMLVVVGSGEILLSDSTRLAEAARAAGVDVLLEVEEDLPHVFQVFATTPEATASTDRIGAFLSARS
jgi:monoterpene epsilon-lactone hydrolase